jgi:hypothetical protein
MSTYVGLKADMAKREAIVTAFRVRPRAPSFFRFCG